MLFASKIIVINQKLQSSKRGDTAECEANRIVTMAAKMKSSETQQFWACYSAIISTSLCHNTNTVWGRC